MAAALFDAIERAQLTDLFDELGPEAPTLLEPVRRASLVPHHLPTGRWIPVDKWDPKTTVRTSAATTTARSAPSTCRRCATPRTPATAGRRPPSSGVPRTPGTAGTAGRPGAPTGGTPTPALATNGTGQVCSLQDMGDIRNHRHHGLIGAIVVLPEGRRPANGAWTGPAAGIVDKKGRTVAEERVLFLQDGLRLFANGDPDAPLPDITSEVDPVDAGQRGISYRAEPIHVRTQLNTVPATPLLTVPAGSRHWLRLVTAPLPTNRATTCSRCTGTAGPAPRAPTRARTWAPWAG